MKRIARKYRVQWRYWKAGQRLPISQDGGKAIEISDSERVMHNP